MTRIEEIRRLVDYHYAGFEYMIAGHPALRTHDLRDLLALYDAVKKHCHDPLCYECAKIDAVVRELDSPVNSDV